MTKGALYLHGVLYRHGALYRQRFWLLIGCIYLILLLGMATVQGNVLVLAIPLLVYLSAAVLFAPGKVALSVERQVDHPLSEQNTPVNVRLVVNNKGTAADECLVQDQPPALICIKGKSLWLGALEAGQAIEIEYALLSRRGKQVFKDIQVCTGEHFGLLYRCQSFLATTEIVCLPKVPSLRKLDIRPQETHGFYGPIPARQSGSGMSFWGVRQYQMGDSLRRINWRASAHYFPGLFTNEYEQERIADVGLILDARQSTNVTVNGQDLFEHSVLAAAALADVFLAAGHRVSLLTYGYALERVYPGYGKVQRDRILRALAEAETGSNFALESLNNLPARLFAPHSQLVLISPLGSRDVLAFVRLLNHGYQALLVSPNPVEFEIQAQRSLPSAGLLGAAREALPHDLEQARRLAKLERNLLLSRLTRMGVRVVDWRVDQPIENAIHAALSRQPAVRRYLRGVIT